MTCGTIPARLSRNVVFPAPLGPRRRMRSPRSSPRESPVSAGLGLPGYRTFRSATRKKGWARGLIPPGLGISPSLPSPRSSDREIREDPGPGEGFRNQIGEQAPHDGTAENADPEEEDKEAGSKLEVGESEPIPWEGDHRGNGSSQHNRTGGVPTILEQRENQLCPDALCQTSNQQWDADRAAEKHLGQRGSEFPEDGCPRFANDERT